MQLLFEEKLPYSFDTLVAFFFVLPFLVIEVYLTVDGISILGRHGLHAPDVKAVDGRVNHVEDSFIFDILQQFLLHRFQVAHSNLNHYPMKP